MKSALERAARALCKLDRHPENIKIDGKPMWQDYLPEARAVLAALRNPSPAMIDLYRGPLPERPSGAEPGTAAILTAT